MSNAKKSLAPTSANRAAKEKLVLELKNELAAASLIVILRQSGLSAAQTLDLRRAMRKAGVSLRVAKNTLARIALADTPAEGLGELLHGSTAIAFSKDPVAAAKVSADFAKGKENVQILGAYLDGKVLDAKAAMVLATLPSIDELRGKLVGLLVAPATKLACIMAAPAGQLARVMAARSRSDA